MNIIHVMEDMKLPYNWTFLGVGGEPSKKFIPENENDIKRYLLNKSKEENYRTIGAGSNLLIRDKGFHGVFIRLNKLNDIYQKNDVLIAEAGALSAKVTKFCVENEIGGLEFISTIPGQIGGLVKMNAGIPEIEMKDVVLWVEFIDEYGFKHCVNIDECGFQYRSSKFKMSDIITKVAFKIEKNKKEFILQKIMNFKNYRKSSQPTIGKLAGCTFKNPVNHKAWKLIENTGIQRFGGTCISEKHKNFIVADNSNSATEIECLIKMIQEKVYEQCAIKLELELEIIGIE